MQRPLVGALLASVVLLGAARPGSAAGHQDPPQGSTWYALPLVGEVHLDSYRDFHTFVAEHNWSRAFRSIEAQQEDPPSGLMPADDGWALSWRERLWRDLVGLERDGRRAFRVFYDAKADKLLADAEAAEDPTEREELRRQVFERYFLCASGDRAADELAHDAERSARWRDAARYLAAILEHHPVTRLDKLDLRLRLARAAAHAGMVAVFADSADRLLLRYEGSEVELDGERRAVEDWIASWSALVEGDGTEVAERPLPERFVFSERRLADTTWSTSLEEVTVELSASRRVYSGRANGHLGFLPEAVLFDGMLLLNQAGKILAVEPSSGSILWEAGAAPPTIGSNNLEGRYFLLPFHDDHGPGLLATGDNDSVKNVSQINLMRLDPRTGEVLWSTRDQDSWGERNLLGRPTRVDDRVFACFHDVGSFQLYLGCFSFETGELLWQMDLGTPASSAADQGRVWFHDGNTESLPITPLLDWDGRHLLVMTDAGTLLAVDLEVRGIAWAYLYVIRETLDRGLCSFASLETRDGLLWFRGQGSDLLHCLDVGAQEIVWARSMEEREQLVGSDADRLYMLDGYRGNLYAYARRDGSRVWKSPAHAKNGVRHVVLTDDSLYVAGTRGIFEVGKEHGRRLAFYRPGGIYELGASQLFLDGGQLIAVGEDGVAAQALPAD